MKVIKERKQSLSLNTQRSPTKSAKGSIKDLCSFRFASYITMHSISVVVLLAEFDLQNHLLEIIIMIYIHLKIRGKQEFYTNSLYLQKIKLMSKCNTIKWEAKCKYL